MAISDNTAECNNDGGTQSKTDIIHSSNNALVLVIGIGDRFDLAAKAVRIMPHRFKTRAGKEMAQ